MSQINLFKNTESLLDKTRKRIEKVLKEYPYLDFNGLYSPYNSDDRQTKLLEKHSVNGFLLCEQWLKIVDYNTTFNKKRSSYRYKHLVEKWANFYISNGTFIVAALANQIEIQEQIEGINCYLKISEKSVKPFENYYRRNLPLPESIPNPIYLMSPE